MAEKDAVSLEVVEIETGVAIKTLDVSKHGPRGVDRVENGIWRQLNQDKYFIRRVFKDGTRSDD